MSVGCKFSNKISSVNFLLVNARNPYGNTAKNTQQGKKPLKNPFANINIRQDDTDNDFQTLNFSSTTDNQSQARQSPFAAKALDDVTNQGRAFFGQPMGGPNRKQPFDNNPINQPEVIHRNGSIEAKRDQPSTNMSDIYTNQRLQGGAPVNQEPYYSNSFFSSLSSINNYFGGGQQNKEDQGAQAYDEDNEPPLLEGKRFF